MGIRVETFTNYYGSIIPYVIGDLYRYKSGDTVRLIGINTKRHVFLFENNHWCTDLVFMDLTNCRTGLTVKETCCKQLTIF